MLYNVFWFDCFSNGSKIPTFGRFGFWVDFELFSGSPHIPTGLDPIPVTPRASYGRPVAVLRAGELVVSQFLHQSIVVNSGPSKTGSGYPIDSKLEIWPEGRPAVGVRLPSSRDVPPGLTATAAHFLKPIRDLLSRTPDPRPVIFLQVGAFSAVIQSS